MNRYCAAAILLLGSFAAVAHAGDWFPLVPENTLVIDTSKGRIVVEMRPDLAPLAVARIRQLSRERLYDGLLFHRVIDGFVDQTGNPGNYDGGASSHPNLPPEFFATLERNRIDAVASTSSDRITGFDGAQPIEAAPVPGHPGQLRVWGAYCDGVAGMGRQAGLDTANSEIFFMRGPARRLDHDYTPWGRVVAGLDVVHAIAIGVPPTHPDRMIQVRVMTDLAAADRPKLEVIDTSSPKFHDEIDAARKRLGADFSVCDVAIETRAAR